MAGMMNALRAFWGELRSGGLNDASVPINSPAAWQWVVGGSETASGERINIQNSLTVPDVYACVRVLAESVASLPLKLYELLPSGKQEAVDAPLYYLLSVAPNPEQSSFGFFETFVGCLALCGNAYAQIERNGVGQPTALWILHPQKTLPFRLKDNTLAYKTTDGSPNGQERIIAAEDVLHCPLFSFNGILGLSPVELAAQSFGLAKAAEKYGARFFGNGSRPGGILSSKTTPDPKTRKELQESWEANQGGINQGKTAFLWGDWTYSQISLSPEASQFLATRQFQRTEICGWFRVPPSYIGDTSRLSNSNHEQQSLSFVTDTLRPYLSRIEAEIVRKLLPTQGRKANKYVVSFDVTERLRGDFQTTMAGFATGRQWGWLTGNDVRRALGMNPGGSELDAYFAPVNMINAKALPDKAPEPQAQPTAAERSVMGELTAAYIRLFRDAVGRITTRNKRDSDAIQACFRPVLVAIAEEVERQAAARFGLNDGWNESQERILKDVLKSLEKRASLWTTAQADDITGAELARSVRSLLVGINREAGAASAIKGLLGDGKEKTGSAVTEDDRVESFV